MVHPVCLLMASLVVSGVVAQTIVCNKANNYGGTNGKIYNLACPPERPYCTGSGLCSECAVGKNSLCDCPPNYQCAAARFNTVRNADFCAPTPVSVIDDTCATSSDCAVTLQSQQSGNNEIAFYATCTSGLTCRYCNWRSYSSTIACTQGEVPGGGDPSHYGSKTGFMACITNVNAWNSQTAVLNPALPTDPYEYERNEYPPPSPTPTGSTTRTPSLSTGASRSPSPTPSLSLGSSASGSVKAMNSSAGSAVVASLFILMVACIVAA